ncbi:cytochrome b5-like heme/steroid binding domain-containing protein [Cytidiella melzeri]|nr:cytochrome b5-like heme/steroid binding domain-containing protein [Cytidiella melzeri]
MSTDNIDIVLVKYPLFGPPKPRLRQNMVKQFSATSLAKHDGRDGGKDVYIAVCGIIYNVNDKKELFQPGGPFDFCAGCDATRALALINAAQENLNGDVGDLGEDEKKCTEEWESFFRPKTQEAVEGVSQSES